MEDDFIILTYPYDENLLTIYYNMIPSKKNIVDNFDYVVINSKNIIKETTFNIIDYLFDIKRSAMYYYYS